MESGKFEELVEKAWANVPGKFKKEMENVVVTIEERQSESQMRGGQVLLGLFEGVPKTAVYSPTMGIQPCNITLFEKNILEAVGSLEELEPLIVEVLMHEIAHYFGYSEKEMRVLDPKLRKRLRGEGN